MTDQVSQEVADLEAQFLKAREERAAREGKEAESVEPVEPKAEPIEAKAEEPKKPEEKVEPKAEQNPEKTQLPEKKESGNNEIEALRSELQKMKADRDAAIARVRPLQQQLSRLQKPTQERDTRQAPAPASALGTAEVKKLEEDFPELKPFFQAFGHFEKNNLELRSIIDRQNQQIEGLVGFLEGEIAPGLDSLHSLNEKREHQSKVAELSSAFSDWNKHYQMQQVYVPDPNNPGEFVAKWTDGEMSPKFAAWLYEKHDDETQRLKQARFSDDPKQVARMWQKFEADTTAQKVEVSGVSQQRKQRLAESAAPNVRPGPAQVRANPDEMSDEERFAYRRAQRKSGALS